MIKEISYYEYEMEFETLNLVGAMADAKDIVNRQYSSQKCLEREIKEELGFDINNNNWNIKLKYLKFPSDKICYGQNVKDFDRGELRKRFGMVLQDTWLFGGTVKDNIRYGNEEATDADIIQVIEQGKHQELLNKNGFYAELYNSPFEDCIDEIE